MPENTTSLEGAYTFRGIDYVVNMHVKSDALLTVIVEDRLTANQWKGSFDSRCMQLILIFMNLKVQYNLQCNTLKDYITHRKSFTDFCFHELFTGNVIHGL